MSIGLVSNKTGKKIQMEMMESTDFDEYLNLIMSLEPIMNHTLAERGPRAKLNCFIGHVYGEVVLDKSNDRACKLSSITDDGMYWCSKISSGQTNAGLACLL